MKDIYLIIMILSCLGEPVFPSTAKPDSIRFLDYDSIVIDLRLNGKSSNFYKHVDYKLMLCLDLSFIKIIESFNSTSLPYYESFANFLSNKDNVEMTFKEYKTNVKSIKDFFQNETSWKYAIDDFQEFSQGNISNYRFSGAIYIKNDTMAAFTIDNVTFMITLKQGKIRLEQLYITKQLAPIFD